MLYEIEMNDRFFYARAANADAAARTILATIDERRGIPVTSESSAERGIVYRA